MLSLLQVFGHKQYWTQNFHLVVTLDEKIENNKSYDNTLRGAKMLITIISRYSSVELT